VYEFMTRDPGRTPASNKQLRKLEFIQADGREEKTQVPPNHPHTGTSMNDLANTCKALSRHDYALAMQARALEFHRLVLPPRHRDVFTVLRSKDDESPLIV